MDAIIHNAGVYTGARVMAVNILAPYLLTAPIDRPQRLIYFSSSEHYRRHADLARTDSNAVDPGWVPTRMGGAGAPDDLRLGHLT
jgi:hypothetical protein